RPAPPTCSGSPTAAGSRSAGGPTSCCSTPCATSTRRRTRTRCAARTASWASGSRARPSSATAWSPVLGRPAYFAERPKQRLACLRPPAERDPQVRCRRVEVASRERRDPVVARQPLAPFVLVALDRSPHERGGLGQLGPEPCTVSGLDRARPHVVELGHGGVEPVARPLEHGERRGLRDAVDRERLPLELARQRLDRPLRPDG